jgi:Kyakuja-Dileera-Zisupton transposase
VIHFDVLFQIPHNPSLADQLSNTYDCYLEIMREVARRVDLTLGQNPSQWQQQNVCPPCLYKTIGVPLLKFSLLACMDGNNSLKLVDSTFRSGVPQTDDRVSASPRWVSPEQVDRFKDEVLKSRTPVCP